MKAAHLKDHELDRVIHQPVRTRIMAMLINVKECDYSTIKKALALSDGHMSTHMKELVEAKYVESEKTFVENKPRTTYRVTKEGKKSFAAYVNALKELVSFD